MERRLFLWAAVGDQAADQVDQEVGYTPVTGMFNLGNVLQLVVAGLNDGPLPQQQFVLRGIRRLCMFLRLGVINSKPWASSWSKRGWEMYPLSPQSLPNKVLAR